MTLASSGPSLDPMTDLQDPSQSSTAGPKTALDCDVVTLARDLRAQARDLQVQDAAEAKPDPMDALYRPLGNKDLDWALRMSAAKRG